MSDYHCENCKFLENKSKGNFIDGYCKSIINLLNFMIGLKNAISA